MRHYNEAVTLQLENKGLEPNRIPSFLRNVENVLSLLPNPTVPEVNRWISSLGYAGIMLDDWTLQCVISAVQGQGNAYK